MLIRTIVRTITFGTILLFFIKLLMYRPEDVLNFVFA
jgi:hypothetical protein